MAILASCSDGPAAETVATGGAGGQASASGGAAGGAAGAGGKIMAMMGAGGAAGGRADAGTDADPPADAGVDADQRCAGLPNATFCDLAGGWRCVNLLTDKLNCGACGYSCPGPLSVMCVAGVCQ